MVIDMDLGACTKILDYDSLMKANGISIPRLRGYRLMSEETILPEKEIEKSARYVYKDTINLLTPTKHFTCLNHNFRPYDKRQVKGHARACYKRYVKQMRTFNRYVGRHDVIMVHARIGGSNWNYFDGPIISMKPWFIEKCDDGMDDTYCDIYVKVDWSVDYEHVGKENQTE